MIKYLKLVSGEDLVADVTEDTAHTYLVKNPVRLLLMPPANVSMMMYLQFLAIDTVQIKKEHVMIEGEPEVGLRNAYNAQFGNGLVIPTAGMPPHIGLNLGS